MLSAPAESDGDGGDGAGGPSARSSGQTSHSCPRRYGRASTESATRDVLCPTPTTLSIEGWRKMQQSSASRLTNSIAPTVRTSNAHKSMRTTQVPLLPSVVSYTLFSRALNDALFFGVAGVGLSFSTAWSSAECTASFLSYANDVRSKYVVAL